VTSSASGKSIVLHPDVVRAVETFRQRYGNRLDDPLFVRERCADLSEEFAELCRDHHVPAACISGARFGEDPRFPGIRLMLAGHYATLVSHRWDELRGDWDGDVVVDWTAHQFTDTTSLRDVPVPWVTPLPAWRAVWTPIEALHD
jgi:hypothetical protein